MRGVQSLILCFAFTHTSQGGNGQSQKITARAGEDCADNWWSGWWELRNHKWCEWIRGEKSQNICEYSLVTEFLVCISIGSPPVPHGYPTSHRLCWVNNNSNLLLSRAVRDADRSEVSHIATLDDHYISYSPLYARYRPPLFNWGHGIWESCVSVCTFHHKIIWYVSEKHH